MTLIPAPYRIEGEITDAQVKEFDNLGFDVTQDHLDRATYLYKATIEQNYYDDLFNALLMADQDIRDEDA